MNGGLFVPMGIALGLGLLVGLQREHTHGGMAGIRTFPLFALLGVLAGATGASLGGWVAGAGFLGVAALLVVANVGAFRKEGGADVGLTTEAAALVMYGVGVALALGLRAEAIVTAGLVAVLLQAKEPLHGMVSALSDRDLRALFQFVLVALVVLPVLPNRDFGPYEVLNPFEIWLMVVLIVGISIAAWAAYRLLGRRRGLALTGILGGFISSTATTVSYARRSRDSGSVRTAAFVVLTASAIVFVRVLIEVAVVVPDAWTTVAPSMVGMLLVLSAMAALEWRSAVSAGSENDPGHAVEASSDLPAALAFALLYALVLLAVAVAREHLGTQGIYAVAALSGLTDMDAITLSTAQLVRADRLETEVAWRAILIGGMANIVFKGGVVVAVGPRTLRAPVLRGFGVSLLAGVAMLLLL